MNFGSEFYRCATALVYQVADWPCFINEVALNGGSIYGDLAIA
jgi:hypothetical protein